MFSIFSDSMESLAKEFPNQIGTVKLAFYKHLERALPNDISKRDTEILEVANAQVINLLTGEEVWTIAPQSLRDTDIDYKREILPLINGRAELLMSSDRSLRELIVATLRMRLVLNQYSKGIDFIDTQEGKRITELLDRYGGEFAKFEPKYYRKLIRRLITNDQIRS